MTASQILCTMQKEPRFAKLCENGMITKEKIQNIKIQWKRRNRNGDKSTDLQLDVRLAVE